MTGTISRRELLTFLMATSALAATAPMRPAWAEELDLTDEELDFAVLQFENDPVWQTQTMNVAPADVDLLRTARRVVVDKVWKSIVKKVTNREPSYFSWAPDDKSIDFRHVAVTPGDLRAASGNSLSPRFDDTPFTLSHAVLDRMAQANYFQLADDEKLVVALRGCNVVNAGDGLQDSVTLKEAVPDHRTYQCMIGVWDRATKKVAAYTGSTVPHELYMAVYQTWYNSEPRPADRWRTNMMPQGLHRKKVGTMYTSRPKRNQLPLSLLQDSPTPVLRAHEGDAMTVSSDWDTTSRYVGDHLHSGIFVNRPYLEFSSQGCQTIRGTNYRSGAYKKDIVHFHQALGLQEPTLDENDDYRSESDDQIIRMMMLSGREARLHAAEPKMAAMKRVRIGSQAPEGADSDHVVKKIQEKLGVGADGNFGHGSLAALLKWQAELQDYPEIKQDGVITPSSAKWLDIVEL